MQTPCGLILLHISFTVLSSKNGHTLEPHSSGVGCGVEVEDVVDVVVLVVGGGVEVDVVVLVVVEVDVDVLVVGGWMHFW